MTPVIKKLSAGNTNEFKDLLRLFQHVFEMDPVKLPDNNYLEKLLLKDDFFVFAALLNTKIVGGLTAYTLPQYHTNIPVVYIYDVAVSTHYQRQGIGKLLVSATLDYCSLTGIKEVFVQAHEADVHALEFYRSTGGNAEKVVHFDYVLNPRTDENNA